MYKTQNYKSKGNLKICFEFDGTSEMAYEVDYKFNNTRIDKDAYGSFKSLSIVGTKLMYDPSFNMDRYMNCYIQAKKGDMILICCTYYGDVTCDKKYSVALYNNEEFYKTFKFYKKYNIDFYTASCNIYSELSLKPKYDIINNVFKFDGTLKMANKLINKYKSNQLIEVNKDYENGNIYLTTLDFDAQNEWSYSETNIIFKGGALFDLNGFLCGIPKCYFEHSYEPLIDSFTR